MRQSGAARIGTLSDYRTQEQYGEHVADPHEGTKLLAGTIEDLNFESAKKYPGLQGLIDVSGGGKIRNLQVDKFTSSITDALLFSTSQEYSERLHNEWLATEGYDTCYRILSARLFFKALSDELAPDYQFVGFANVVYAEEIDIATPLAGIHPALVKRNPRHSVQSEVRAIWQPSANRELTPLILPKSRANLYCVHHSSLGQDGA